MREIKFRGKTYATGKWKYGDLIKPDRIFVNKNELIFLVDKNTIGQYTGLKDKNGKEIYEGDILREYGNEIDDWIVSYEDGKFIGTCDDVCEDLYEIDNLEVIGNIYENKNLLEKENK